MPKWPEDYPPIEGLKAAVERKLLPRPASTSPVLDRAIGNLTKIYPKDMADTTITDLPWDNPRAGSSILGETNLQSGSHQEVGINPILSRAFPQIATEGTIAHELEHTRQNRQFQDNESLIASRAPDQKLNYWLRPSEAAARAARTRYFTDSGSKYQGDIGMREPTEIRSIDPNALQALSRVMRPPREDTIAEAIQRALRMGGIDSNLE